jgi:hypothetical protein
MGVDLRNLSRATRGAKMAALAKNGIRPSRFLLGVVGIFLPREANLRPPVRCTFFWPEHHAARD